MESKVIEKNSKQHSRHVPRMVEYWAGRKLTKATSDLFLDRPRPANTLFSGIGIFIQFKCFIYIIFKGPNAISNQQYPIRDIIGEVNEGEASALRSLDLGYLTRFIFSN